MERGKPHYHHMAFIREEYNLLHWHWRNSFLLADLATAYPFGSPQFGMSTSLWEIADAVIIGCTTKLYAERPTQTRSL